MKSPNVDLSRYWTVEQASKIYGISRSALYARLSRGRFPPCGVMRIGRSVFLDRKICRKVLEKRR